MASNYATFEDIAALDPSVDQATAELYLDIARSFVDFRWGERMSHGHAFAALHFISHASTPGAGVVVERKFGELTTKYAAGVGSEWDSTAWGRRYYSLSRLLAHRIGVCV
jgi:hypothetical protein